MFYTPSSSLCTEPKILDRKAQEDCVCAALGSVSALQIVAFDFGLVTVFQHN